MKRVWRISFKMLAISGLVCGSMIASAQKSGDPQFLEELSNMSFVQMVNSVELNDKKTQELIVRFQEMEGRNKLHNKHYNKDSGCTVETYRNKEVLLITIPASKLFAPNDVELRDNADKLLNPIKRYLKSGDDMYRVLVVMHTDNTGSEQYREELTEDRADAIVDWFENSGVNTDYLFSYSFSDDQPLVPNNSIDNREKNRRLEIYLVPGKKMLDEAKKGRIEY